MTTIKTYTDIEQSKILSKILPLESADISYCLWKDNSQLVFPVPLILDGREEKEGGVFDYTPCWSFAALLNIIPKRIKNDNILRIDIGEKDFSIWYDKIGYGVNRELPDITMECPIDVCFNVILRLHEQNLL